jgi:hypothetical protein
MTSSIAGCRSQVYESEPRMDGTAPGGRHGFRTSPLVRTVTGTAAGVGGVDRPTRLPGIFRRSMLRCESLVSGIVAIADALHAPGGRIGVVRSSLRLERAIRHDLCHRDCRTRRADACGIQVGRAVRLRPHSRLARPGMADGAAHCPGHAEHADARRGIARLRCLFAVVGARLFLPLGICRRQRPRRGNAGDPKACVRRHAGQNCRYRRGK